jgi:hypothetical protein
MVSPPPDVGSQAGTTSAGAASTAPNRTGTSPATAASGPSGTDSSSALPEGPPAIDRADIRPLDLAGALQILVAEVRAALVEALIVDLQVTDPADAAVQLRDSTNSSTTGAPQDLDAPVPAARVLVDLVLRSLPQTFEPESWSVALPRVDLALQLGIQRGIDVVSAWRDIPPAVVEATQESANLALALIADEPLYPWPPTEWLGLAPRLGRLWRRRRFLKRRLVDPDHGGEGKWDDLDEPKP